MWGVQTVFLISKNFWFSMKRLSTRKRKESTIDEHPHQWHPSTAGFLLSACRSPFLRPSISLSAPLFSVFFWAHFMHGRSFSVVAPSVSLFVDDLVFIKATWKIWMIIAMLWVTLNKAWRTSYWWLPIRSLTISFREKYDNRKSLPRHTVIVQMRDLFLKE